MDGAKEEVKLPPEDPRQRCCFGGRTFFDALLAMISRFIFLLHVTVLFVNMLEIEIWRNNIYASLAVAYCLIVTEALVVLFVRKGKEWKWFSPSILMYVICVCSHIWLMEEARYKANVLLENLPNTNVSRTVILSNSGIPIALDYSWTWYHTQVMLLAIILSRWLMPKGDLNRDQLSALLVMYVATASDIVDFFNVLEEIKVFQRAFDFHILLFVWAWSMFQFPFVRTATRSIDDDDDDSSDPKENVNADTKVSEQTTPWYRRVKSGLLTWLENESWALMITIIFQDGPFLLLRTYLAVRYTAFNRTTLFFIGKNSIVLILQFYRLIALHVHRKQQEQEKREEFNRKTLARLSRRAFMTTFMSNAGKTGNKYQRSTSVEPLA